MNSSHTTGPALCAASPAPANHKKSHRLSPKAADEAKKRGERVDKTGRNASAADGIRHTRVHGYLLASAEWNAASCLERVALIEVMSRDMGQNNGAIRCGARTLSKAIGCSISTAGDALLALRKAGLLVLTNAPSRDAKAAAESAWLIPWVKDTRKGTQPTPFTAYWNKLRKGDDTYAKLGHDILSSAAWNALKSTAKVLLVSLIHFSKRKNDIEVSNAKAGEFIGASADAGRRALNDLERHGFLRRRKQGQSLAGGRITATYSLDLFHRNEDNRIVVAEARYRQWRPGHDFEVLVGQGNVRRPKAEPVAERQAPKAAKPASPPATKAPPTVTAPQPITEPTELAAIEEDIDMADPTSIRTAERLLRDLHHRQIDAVMEKFPMNAEGLSLFFLEAVDLFGEARAVAMVRQAAYRMVGNRKASPATLRTNLRALKREEEREASIAPDHLDKAV